MCHSKFVIYFITNEAKLKTDSSGANWFVKQSVYYCYRKSPYSLIKTFSSNKKNSYVYV